LQTKEGSSECLCTVGEKIRKMARVYYELSTELAREPTDEEVARKLGWDVGRD
jgi:DNA-directed RNA polymerase specialized sigma subunit